MRCIVTAGPTYEPLDAVRRLTNFSTGRLGSLLASHLAARGHDVTLLLSETAVFHGLQTAQHAVAFSTTDDLQRQLQTLAGPDVGAVFHAAAVSDFRFGKIQERLPDGSLRDASSGKISTRGGTLLAELLPTPKIIASLRDWFPQSWLVGWKYEVEGGRESALAAAQRQIAESRTDACIANGPAYGPGFGLVRPRQPLANLADMQELFGALECFLIT